jgi:peptidyl-prolyl cis-trans isomerase C
MVTAGISCRQKIQGPIVARVGQHVLTLDDLYKSIPPEYSDFITREQMINYVKQWIDNQILFEEALRLKIDKEDAIKVRLARMKQDLLCAEMINRNSISSQNIQISDDMIQNYYNENKNKFLREKDAARYIQIVVEDATTAWSVRTQANPDNFLFLASKYSKIPVADPRTVPFVNISDIPPQIAQEITSIRVKGTSNPIKTDLGFHLVHVLDKQPKGSIRKIEEVRDDIINVLSTKTQNAAIEQMLSGLRSKMAVEVHLDIVPNIQKSANDSAPAQKPHVDSTDIN